MKPSSPLQPAAFPTLGKPFRVEPSPKIAPVVGGTINLALTVVADMLNLHGTCPRRACRGSCNGAHDRLCAAEFPPVAFDMVQAIHMFALTVSPSRIAALQDHVFCSMTGPDAAARSPE